jgi:hypothetical protein
MLAIVKTAKSIRASLKYNEQKVEQKQAHLLDAHNFWQNKNELSTRDKLQRFNDLTVLNQRSQKHAVHISLNFPPEDQLTDLRMKQIAAEFMRGIGFAEQPWLLYRHIDAGHPHMHIVTTNIRPDGSRITNDLRSPYHLKKLCYTIEQRYGLAPAIRMPDLFSEEKSLDRKGNEERASRIIIYGEAPTKTEIARVLEQVINRYAFTSFESFNAVLGAYHVRADRGREDSPMYNNRGLYYRIIDSDGKKLGAPIKASAFQIPVTLQHLEEKFRLNEARLNERAKYVQMTIDWRFMRTEGPYSLAIIKDALRRDGIDLVVPDLFRRPARQTAAPQPGPDDGHGFFYVDHSNKVVIRDTQLGQQFTAAAILRDSGIEKDIRQLVAKGRFQLTKSEQIVFSRPGEVSPAETRRVLFNLSDRHAELVDQRLSWQQELQLSQNMGRGLSR